MATYACTKCMQWFHFDQLTEDELLCSTCDALKVVSKPKSGMKRKSSQIKKLQCMYCQTSIKTNQDGNNGVCKRCEKNHNEHGEPRTCIICKLKSAFIGSKCQRCASSLKKYGAPVKCGKCCQKAAFDHAKARIDGVVLCWICFITKQRNMQHEKKMCLEPNSEDVIFEETVVYEESDGNDDSTEDVEPPPSLDVKAEKSPENVWKELLGEDSDHKETKLSINRNNIAALEKMKSAEERSESPNRMKFDVEQKVKSGNQPAATVQAESERARQRRLLGSLDDRIKSFQQKMDVDPARPRKALTPIREIKSLTPIREIKSDSNHSTPRVNLLSEKAETESPKTPVAIQQTTSKLMDRVRASQLPDASVLPAINDGNIVVVTKLREEISLLKKQLMKKDQDLLEKDKQTSMLKVEHIREVRALQARIVSQEEDYIKSLEALRTKNQDLLRKIAQVSKGKL